MDYKRIGEKEVRMRLVRKVTHYSDVKDWFEERPDDFMDMMLTDSPAYRGFTNKVMTYESFDKFLGTVVHHTNTGLFEDDYYGVSIKETKHDDKNYVLIYDDGYNFVSCYENLKTIYDDEKFIWKKAKKTGDMTAVLEDNNFKFKCTYREIDKESVCYVDCIYTKCENQHRNNVTVANIRVYDPTNKDILDAIRNWKDMFKASL